MSQLINLNNLQHRTRERVRDLGEVFTPEKYAEDMLKVLAKDTSSIWSDESTVFFEPSCGHGNIILPIYKKRLEAFCKKANAAGFKSPALYAVANSLNTLWGVDIDSKNIQECKYRILCETVAFLKVKTKNSSTYALVSKNKDFFAHLFCALNWQIHENEALSGLSEESKAKENASKTKIGKKWFDKNGHKELDFDFSWVVYFRESSRDRVVPMEFIRSEKYVANLLNGTIRGFEEFNFANYLSDEFSIEGSRSRAMEA